MKDKIISLGQDMSCPFCLSHMQSPIFLKNSKQALDSYFLKNPEEVKSRPHFFNCLECFCIFRNPFFILPENEEHQRYFTHNNDLEDQNYLSYLNQSIKSFLPFITPNEAGLDFGCGPTKGIEFILNKIGIKLSSYDKYFFPETLETKFDYIFCHEVVEHFVDVRQELEKLIDKLKPNGRLFIRTELHPEDFENWYYKNDSTHVFFFSEKTFKKMASDFNLDFIKLEKNKFMVQKK